MSFIYVHIGANKYQVVLSALLCEVCDLHFANLHSVEEAHTHKTLEILRKHNECTPHSTVNKSRVSFSLTFQLLWCLHIESSVSWGHITRLQTVTTIERACVERLSESEVLEWFKLTTCPSTGSVCRQTAVGIRWSSWNPATDYWQTKTISQRGQTNAS